MLKRVRTRALLHRIRWEVIPAIVHLVTVGRLRSLLLHPSQLLKFVLKLLQVLVGAPLLVAIRILEQIGVLVIVVLRERALRFDLIVVVAGRLESLLVERLTEVALRVQLLLSCHLYVLGQLTSQYLALGKVLLPFPDFVEGLLAFCAVLVIFFALGRQFNPVVDQLLRFLVLILFLQLVLLLGLKSHGIADEALFFVDEALQNLVKLALHHI